MAVVRAVMRVVVVKTGGTERKTRGGAVSGGVRKMVKVVVGKTEGRKVTGAAAAAAVAVNTPSSFTTSGGGLLWITWCVERCTSWLLIS